MFKLFGKDKEKPEERATVTQASDDFRALVGVGLLGPVSATGKTVNTTTAMQVPAFASAVNFISGTIAGLPLKTFERVRGEKRPSKNPLSFILHDNVSDEMTSFAWRKYTFERVLTDGRAFTLILRNGNDVVSGLAPLDPNNVTVERKDGLTFYHYKENNRNRTYNASDIIDIPFMLKADGLQHIGPISVGKEALGLALGVQEYASKFFAGGGVPQFAVSGNFMSAGAMQRASEDLADAIRRASAEGRQVLTMPDGLSFERLGTNPDDTQLLETQKFCVEQVARIFSLPPTFLQDLSHGTFSNTEQQDLHFVKHTLKRWIEQFEAELNLKLWGRQNRKFYAEFSVDGLLRGDFKTRMEGNASAITHGVLTPNEARAMENRAPMENGDQLLIQGATVPLGSQEADNET